MVNVIVFRYMGRRSQSRSQGQKFWYEPKGLITRNVHVKYESPTSNSSKLEWGCPNGTKYPPRQPIQTIQVMHQIGEAVMRCDLDL